ncbi:hypothetical protein GCM10007898_14770 [Dyella flagellata]|uniref:Carrier domain-containing protein n=1 Tax=Dyella flagellata TaxID=1867833 RepID=A0ABQ5X9J0_9GAMM|nr:hypothetical protein GCM10007898_14770 [Dyella flagellata]
MLVVSHLVADAASLRLLCAQLARHYTAFRTGENLPGPAQPVLQYGDYAIWQRRQIDSEAFDTPMAYWLDKLGGRLPRLRLAGDYAPARLTDLRGAVAELRLPLELTNQLRAFSKQHGSTVYIVLLCVFLLELYRYSSQEDLLVGTPVAGRTHPAFRELVGPMANILVLRHQLAPGERFLDLLAQAKQTWAEALSHDVPFECLLRKLRPERTPARSLFQAMLDVQMEADAQASWQLEGQAAEPVAFDTGAANFDLHLTLTERNQALEGVLIYKSGLFSANTAQQIARDIPELVARIIAGPERSIETLLGPRPRIKPSVVVAGNFLIDPVVEMLDAWLERLQVSAHLTTIPMDGMVPALLDHDSPLNRNRDGINLVLISPTSSPGAPAARQMFLDALRARMPGSRELCCVLLQHATGTQVGEAEEAAWLTALHGMPGVVLKDFRQLAAWYGVSEISEPAAEAAAQLPYAESYCVALGTHLARHAWRSLVRPPKVFVVDCDHTLWEGVCSEQAIAELGVDEGRARFQQLLLAQVQSGALLCLCSRNEEADVLRVLQEHPHMLVRMDAIATYRINHLSKAQNIASIAMELNLNPDDFVFIDDDPLECADVAQRLPGVCWLQFPRERAAIGHWLDQLWMLDIAKAGVEATLRASFYAQSEQRAAHAARYATLRALLQDSQLRYGIRVAASADDERVAELTRRTNQFNLHKQPLDTTQATTWRMQPDGRVWVMSASDRFGDYGTVGVVMARREHATLRIVQFLLSCRAMNRGLEYALMRFIVAKAREEGANLVQLPFHATPKNRPARLFMDGLAQACGTVGKPEHGCRLDLDAIDAGVDALESALLDKPFAQTGDLAEIPVQEAAPAPEQQAMREQAGVLRELAAAWPVLPAIRRLIRRREHARDTGVAYAAAQTDAQRLLAEIVGEHLNVEQLGIHDDLFALGMDSLRALQVASSLQKRGHAIGIDDVFERRTIEELAALCGTPAAIPASPQLDRAPFQDAGLGEDEIEQLRGQGIEDAYPLSSTQAGMVFHAERDIESPLYQVIDSFKLRGPFRGALFAQALSYATARHPALRTAYQLARYERPMQLVYRDIDIPLQMIDLRAEQPDDQSTLFEAWLRAETTRRFDIGEPPLVRYTVHRFAEDVFQVSLTQHHAMLDGWSLNSLIKELLTVYARLLAGRALPAPQPPQPSFAHFIQREQSALSAPEQRMFWQRKLANLEASPLPYWPGQQAAQGIVAEATHVVIPLALGSALFDVARRAGTPIKSVLLAAHLRVVMYLTGRTDVVTGLLVNGRMEGGQGEQALGLFVNSVPLRARFNSGSWLDLVRLAFVLERELQPHRLYPLSSLQRITTVNPLFEFLFTFTHFHVLEGVREQRDFEVLDTLNFVRDNIPLQAFFDIDPFNERHVRLMLGYDAARIPPAELDRIAALYLELLGDIAAQPERSCFMPDLPKALAQHLKAGTQPAPADGAFVSVPRQIAAQARRRPDKIAIAGDDWQLSYAALDRHAAMLAHALRQRGIGPECVVGVAMENGPLAVLAMLGIWRAGAAYLPIDPSYPAARVAGMLHDSAVTTLLCEHGTATLVTSVQGLDILPIEMLLAEPPLCVPVHAAIGDVDADALAYVIYTSGSTGRPKGVMIAHGTLAALFRHGGARFGFDAADVWSLFHSLSFDFSVWELWSPLVSGGTLVPIPDMQRLDPQALQHYLLRHQVSVLNLTPSAISRLLTGPRPLSELVGGWSVKRLIAGGEALPEPLGKQWLDAGVTLWNFYGPTEATVWTCAFQVRDAHDLERLGEPFAHVALGVMSAALQLAPVAVAGEMVIGGGLARGYHRQPALTADRFRPDPFSLQPGGRLYRTGDLGRYRQDGAMQFVGRMDQQRKIRGYRVELGEIEAALSQHPGIDQAVCVGSAADEPVLLAYYTCKAPSMPGQDELRQLLAQHLPAHMMPSRLIELAALPLSPNGKIDRKALAKPPAVAVDEPAAIHALSTDERLVANVWSAVLGVRVEQPQANFFDLGGDSLKAVQVTARLRLHAGDALPLRALFQHATLEAYAAVLPRYRGSVSALLEHFPAVGAKAEMAPLTQAQRRLWLVDQLVGERAVYNIPLVFACRGRLDLAALEAALRQVMGRQRMLSAHVVMYDGEPHQTYSHDHLVPVRRLSLREGLSGKQDELQRRQEIERHILAEVQLPFELEAGPLIRLSVLEVADEHAYIVAVLHHLIADAWSVAMLRGEIAAQYRAAIEGTAAPAAPLDVEYFDYAIWQQQYLTVQALQGSYAYWQDRLQGGLPPLPLGRGTPGHATRAEAIVRSLHLDQAALQALKTLAHEHQVTLFTVLLSAFKVTLYALSRQADIWIGTGVANRAHPGMEPIVGLFVNTLVFRSQLQPGASFGMTMAAVHEQVTAAQEHQHVPFEELVRIANPARVGRDRPLFHALFELHNAPNPSMTLPGLELEVVDISNGFAKYAISLQLQETPQGLRGVLETDARLCTAEETDALLARFQHIVQDVLRDTRLTLEQLAVTPPGASPEARHNRRQQRLSAAFSRSAGKVQVDGEQADGIRRSLLPGMTRLPLLFQLRGGNFALDKWIRAHRHDVDRELAQHGAILFRGFGIDSAAAMRGVAGALMEQILAENGEHVAVPDGGGVQTPVFYAPESKLLWHNENTFNDRWPRRILFACRRPAPSGGETPLVDSREVFNRLPPAIREAFVRKGVMYVRYYGQRLGLPWSKVFGSESREQVEAQCRAAGFRYQWLDDGSLRTMAVRPAVWRHPESGDWCWCNQAQHWHIACLDATTRAYIVAATEAARYPRACYFGDGTPIPDAVMQDILDVYAGLEVSFPWQQGDVLLVDNMLVAHGRNPYRGERELLVALGDTFRPDEPATAAV